MLFHENNIPPELLEYIELIEQNDYPTTPAIVCDVFSGSGTTLLVARKLGRCGIGLDISAEYLDLAKERLGLKALEQWEAGKPGETNLEGLPMFDGNAENEATDYNKGQ